MSYTPEAARLPPHERPGHFDAADLIARLENLAHMPELPPARRYCPTPIDWLDAPLVRRKPLLAVPEPPWVKMQAAQLRSQRRLLGAAKVDEMCRSTRRRWAHFSGLVTGPKMCSNWDVQNIFPKELLCGLLALREQADRTGLRAFHSEYAQADQQRRAISSSWSPCKGRARLPSHIQSELDSIETSAVQAACDAYTVALSVCETKMTELIAFYAQCGLIPAPLPEAKSWWLAAWWVPICEREHVEYPSRMLATLQIIDKTSPTTSFARAVEYARWKESYLSTGREPPQEPLPENLLHELLRVWSTISTLGPEVIESDLMNCLAQFREWQANHGQESRPQRPRPRRVSSASARLESARRTRQVLKGQVLKGRITKRRQDRSLSDMTAVMGDLLGRFSTVTF